MLLQNIVCILSFPSVIYCIFHFSVKFVHVIMNQPEYQWYFCIGSLVALNLICQLPWIIKQDSLLLHKVWIIAFPEVDTTPEHLRVHLKPHHYCCCNAVNTVCDCLYSHLITCKFQMSQFCVCVHSQETLIQCRARPRPSKSWTTEPAGVGGPSLGAGAAKTTPPLHLIVTWR